MQVTVIDDSVHEGPQEFFAQLTTTDSGVTIFEPGATAQITDDDGRAIPSIYFTNCDHTYFLCYQKSSFSSTQPLTL